MKLRVLTAAEPVADEAKRINQLFEKGLTCLHLRKPNYTIDEYVALLDAIDDQWYDRIITHSFFELVEAYGLRGIHLREAYRQSLSQDKLTVMLGHLRKQGLQVGTSVHSPETLEQLPKTFNYVFVSPVFESISKQGYKPSVHWDIRKLKRAYTFRLVGLGGIAPHKIVEAKQLGFEEVATLGAIWQQPNRALTQFEQFQNHLTPK